jgi:pimeloyl-ACP methyl ester carboxylesterase
VRSGPTDHDPLTGSTAPPPTTAVDPPGPERSTPIASTDAVTVVLHDLGGSGPLLLLAHATGFHGRVWGPCASHLRDRHCVAPDLRGHGDSVVPDDIGFAWSGFADDILAVVDHLGGGPLIAAGHSKGGASLLLAEQRRPGTFAGLYLFEPIVFPPAVAAMQVGEDGRPSNPLAAGARRRRPTFESYDAAYENFAAKAPFDALDPDALRAYVDGGFRQLPDGSVTLKCRPENEAQVYEMGSQHDAYEHLAEVRCPVTVGFGFETPFSPATFARPIVEQLPNATLDPHPELGHFGPLEDPAAIAGSIRAALIG